MSRNKLRTVDELGEVGARGPHEGRHRDGPTLRLRFTTNLVVLQLHFCAAFQSLKKQNSLQIPNAKQH